MSVAKIKQDQDNTEAPVAQKRLISFVERIENLEQEKADISEDVKDIYTELKAAGFDAKATRDIVKYRKMDSGKRREYFDLLGVYAEAVQLDLF